MRYVIAWMLGVPFSVIAIWYIVGHAARPRTKKHRTKKHNAPLDHRLRLFRLRLTSSADAFTNRLMMG